MEELDVETISFVKGAGVFDVSVDGKLVYSKYKSAIFKIDDVKEQDVINAIKAACVAACGDKILEKCR